MNNSIIVIKITSSESSTEHLFSIVPLKKSFIDFVQYVREHFDEYESEYT
jgi:hypothetical protein